MYAGGQKMTSSSRGPARPRKAGRTPVARLAAYYSAGAAYLLAGLQLASAKLRVYNQVNEDSFRLLYVPKKGEVVQKPVCDPTPCGLAPSASVVPVAEQALRGYTTTSRRTRFLSSRRGAGITTSKEDHCCGLLAMFGLLTVSPQMELPTYFNDQAAKEKQSAIRKPIDGEQGLCALVTPEPFLPAVGGEKSETEAHMKASAALYFPNGPEELRDVSIARHTVELENQNTSQRQKFVMHWWSESDRSLRESSAGVDLTRFVYSRLSTSPDGAASDSSGWVGRRHSAEWFRPTRAQQTGRFHPEDDSYLPVTEAGVQLQTLDQMRAECEAGTGLHRLDETALQTQTVIMQQAVTQNFQKADGTALKPEEVELTLWWSARRNVDGLWLVGTLKELKEAVKASHHGDKKYIRALEMNVETPVEVRRTTTGTTITFKQRLRDEHDQEVHAYDENDRTKYVLYLAGSGRIRKLTATPKAAFSADKKLRYNAELPAGSGTATALDVRRRPRGRGQLRGEMRLLRGESWMDYDADHL